ncbi:MAG: SDR family oxidoreductase [Ruminococcaceae bacterium]|nr:SDR family oxidoreductase [Oscillospiraceae bacterium]
MKKTAVITGASGGIGKAICYALARDGYNIILHYNKNKAEAEKTALQLKNTYGTEVFILGEDLSADEGGRLLGEKIKSVTNGVDVLVNNAGLSLVGVFQCLDSESVRRLLNVNLANAMSLTAELLPLMINKKSGSIINISSVWGVVGGSCEVHYSASKAGLIGFTRALAKEAGASGIRVNCIAPGFIETAMNARFDEEAVRGVVEETPLCRTGSPEDVAELVSFLAGEKSGFITGQTIGIDGGLGI